MFVSRLFSIAARPTHRSVTLRYNSEFKKFRYQSHSLTLGTRHFSADDKDKEQLTSNLSGPSLDKVRSSPLSIVHATNETIIRLSAELIPEGCIEQLKRHIMVTKSIEYPEACKIFEEIKTTNSNISPHLALPNKAGLIASVTGGFLSFPLCFHYDTVQWFNERFVTADIPEPKDLETWLEVGSWAWNWMEPVMGQLSFLLLCLAFARSQFQTLGITPFSQKIKDERAAKLVKKFPMYDEKILSDFSRSQPFDWIIVRKIRSIMT